MSFVDSVVRPVLALVLAATIANCNEGCLPGYTQIDPATAYAMEVSGCVSKRNAEVLNCANQSVSMPEYEACRYGAEESERKCRAQVDRKYLEYNSNGSYPSQYTPPGR